FHSYLLGPTGSGKTTAMLHLIMSDIEAGKGVFVLDPKSDLVRDVLARVPEHRKKDVVVIDPMSINPIGINPFAAISEGADPGVVADGLLAVFQKVSGSAWGKRMEDVLACSLLTLARTKDANLLMLAPLLTDAKFRQKITEPLIKADPQGLGTFWKSYESMSDTVRRQVIAPAMSRLRAFTLREPLRYILGQSNPKFNLNDLFTENKIVLVALNKGKMGSEIAHLIGLTIISQVWSLTLARTDIPQEERDFVGIYIDEVHNFLSLPVGLEEALSQARALGVGFTLANQHLAQLTSELQSAIFANVANWIVFGLYSPEDCQALSKFAGSLSPEDFKYLPRYHVYFRCLFGGKPIWVSGKTLPPCPRTTNPDKLTILSESLYGSKRAEIDADNMKRFNFEQDIAELLEKTEIGLEVEDE
ncbi:type IV secretory system conjugative DNA transfer family protein, partial [Ruminococcaceae bacterium OttesenSCG-928-A11]|nr:type IV secretory system conjugative DNA transfer family protein [Ruminococcaceae bacterium OttesenSCG-928-A11]